jgi:hypothetical protein
MSRASFALPLALSLGAAHCGTEEIELRSPEAPAALPAPPAAEAELDVQPISAGEPVGSSEQPPAVAAAAPVREGVLIPSAPLSPLPTAFDPLPVPERGCRALDFLFVIDDSISMFDEQNNLARSFPGFIAVLEQLLDAQDSHILVTTSSGRAEDEAAPTLEPAACESVRGAGRRRSRLGGDCGIVGGLPYMTNGQPNLEATFSCVAQQGIVGSSFEEPMAATLAATSAALNTAGRCNSGFLRDDALLIVTLISDEDDTLSPGGPEEWRAQLLAAKGGNESALVVLGLLGDNNVQGGLLGGPCGLLDADGAPRLQQLVGDLGGMVGSVCAADYAPFFQTAAGAVDGTCHDFIPPSLLPRRQ